MLMNDQSFENYLNERPEFWTTKILKIFIIFNLLIKKLLKISKSELFKILSVHDYDSSKHVQFIIFIFFL